MIYLLYNPKANNGRAKEDLKLIPDKYTKDSVFMDVLQIKDYKAFVDNLKDEDIIVLAGGDGTLCHFINDVDTFEMKNDVYFYGIGTGNDFLNDINKSGCKEPVLINEYIKSLPTAWINGRKYRFINDIGFGMDGYCCEEGDKHRAVSDKPVNYTIIALKGLIYKFKRRKAKVTVDGVTKHYSNVVLAPAMMGRFYGGGMMIAPSQDRLNKEHLLTNVVLHTKRRLSLLPIFSTVFKGKHTKYQKIFDFRTGHEITVEFDSPCALQIDGETILNVTKYTVKYE